MYEPSTMTSAATSRHSGALTQRLIQAMVAKTSRYFGDNAAAMVKRVREHLLDVADSKVTLAQGQNMRSAAVLLDRQAGPFLTCFAKALQDCMNEEISSTMAGMAPETHTRPASLDELDGMSLSLIDVDEVHRILLLDRVAMAFNTVYEPSLTPLSQRLSALQGVHSSALSINPFRPIVFLKAFMNAWDDGEFDDQATEDLVQTLVPEQYVDLKPLYADLISMLDQAGVQVDTTLRIKKSPNGAPSGFAGLGSDGGNGPGESAGHTGAGPAQGGRAGAAGAGAGGTGAGGTGIGGTGGPGGAGSPGGYAGGIDNGGTPSAWSGLAPIGRSIASQARAFLQKLGIGPQSHGGDSGGGDASAGLGNGVQAPMYETPQAPADPQLMAYLHNMQTDGQDAPHYHYVEGRDPTEHNVLRHMREQDAIKGAPELDRGTVDALAEVFDFVFSDRSIPPQMKVVIGRLQIPVLKAAMMDRDFFQSGNHPARKLVDTLASASVGWVPEKGENDPLFVRIERTVQRVLNEFEDDLALFSDLLLEFTEFLFESEQQAEKNVEPVAKKERDHEALAAARAHADDIVRERINVHTAQHKLAPFLAPFLTNQWRDVVANAWLEHEEKPDDWTAAVETMDRLIWSTQPKTSSEDRRQLVDVLPELVRKINSGLDEIKWDGQDRATFTRRLIGTHMLAIRMKAQAEPQDSKAAALEDHASAEAMQALDQRIANKLAGQIDGYDDAAHELARGTWFEFSEAGGVQYRCKLSWVSPMRTRFLFTNRDGFEAFVRSEREVANMLRLGTLRALDQAPIVSRAIDKLLGGSAEVDIELAV